MWRLAGIVAICFLLRAAVALHYSGICADGRFFISTARDIEAGIPRPGIYFPSYIYVNILVALHRAGLGWEVAAKGWGACIATLAVLPLFGWLRRQFDEGVALIACLLYALHPDLILESVQPIRDATYWFFLLFALHLGWRAATEGRLSLSLLSGLAAGAATATRLEGCFLFFPLIFWPLAACRTVAAGRLRAVCGIALSLGVCPALLLLFSLTHPRSEACGTFADTVRIKVAEVYHLGRDRVALAIDSRLGTAHAGAGAVPDPSEVYTSRRYVNRWAEAISRGIGPLYGLFLIAGLWARRSSLWQGGHLPLLLASGAILASIVAYLIAYHAIQDRYFATLLLYNSPYLALGFSIVCRQLSRHLHQFSSRLEGHLGVILLIGVLAAEVVFRAGWRDESNFLTNQAVGDWVAKQRKLLTDEPIEIIVHGLDATIVSFYSNSTVVDDESLTREALTSDRLVHAFDGRRRVMFILCTREREGAYLSGFELGIMKLGFTRVAVPELQAADRGIFVYIRHAPPTGPTSAY
jgi:hypothetical protein